MKQQAEGGVWEKVESREGGSTSWAIRKETGGMSTQERLERIRAAVMAEYASSTDVCVRNGLRHWLEQRCENVDEPFGDLAHVIASPEMVEHAIRWNKLDVEEDIALERAKLAGVRVRNAREQFIAALAETEGYCTDDNDNVVIPRPEVWRVDKEKLKRAMPRKVVDFSRAVASGDVPLADLLKGMLPPAFKEIRLVGNYAKDLADFLTRTGEEGQALIKEICDNLAYAANLVKHGCSDEVSDGDKAPLEFLAKQVMDTHTHKAALSGKRPVGFAAASAIN